MNSANQWSVNACVGDWIRTFGEPDSSAPTGYSVSTSRESLVVSILSAGTFLGTLDHLSLWAYRLC